MFWPIRSRPASWPASPANARKPVMQFLPLEQDQPLHCPIRNTQGQRLMARETPRSSRASSLPITACLSGKWAWKVARLSPARRTISASMSAWKPCSRDSDSDRAASQIARRLRSTHGSLRGCPRLFATGGRDLSVSRQGAPLCRFFAPWPQGKRFEAIGRTGTAILRQVKADERHSCQGAASLNDRHGDGGCPDWPPCHAFTGSI